MLQIIINGLIILMLLGFIALVLVELGRSQEQMESVRHVPNMLRLAIDMRDSPHVIKLRLTHHAETLEELQGLLNAIPAIRIHRAGVWNGTTMTHVMDDRGVLEAV